MKNLISINLVIILFLLLSSCTDDILNQNPKGSVSSEVLDNPAAAEALVIASYAGISQVYGRTEGDLNINFLNPASNWILSDVRSDEAYKGGGGTGDLGPVNSLELGIVSSTDDYNERKWRALYISISRTNKALAALNSLTEVELPEKFTRIAEVRVLRGYFYFELKKIWNRFPYIDENDLGSENEVPIELSSEQLWDLIIADFQAGVDVLPETQSDVNRVNKYTAHAFLAKTHLFLQNYSDVIDHADEVIDSGNYRLLDNLQDLYGNPETDNDGENIFAVINSVNDGSFRGSNSYYGDLLCSPPGPAYGGGDGFRIPTQNMVNTFKVDENGLPFLETFNDSDLAPNDTNTPVDPRLDHAIGRPGIPWKDYTGEVYGSNWQRSPQIYGPYATKKNIINPESSLRASGGFPWAMGAYNYPLMKYSDVLLWKAEALIESNTNLDEARQLINKIRQRASDSPVVMRLDGSGPAANYQIGLYEADGWTQDVARKALRMERRLELGLEGHRFFDLIRWGIVAEVMNEYYETESQKRNYLSGGNFQPGNEYLPLPHNEVERSGGLY